MDAKETKITEKDLHWPVRGMFKKEIAMEKTIRSFWRRIYKHRNKFEQELPDTIPVELLSAMTVALEHIEAISQSPSGMVIVPIEPKLGTLELMWKAYLASRANGDKLTDRYRAIYSAMIKAHQEE